MAWKASELNIHDKTMYWLTRNANGIFNFGVVDESLAHIFNTVQDARVAAKSCAGHDKEDVKFIKC